MNPTTHEHGFSLTSLGRTGRTGRDARVRVGGMVVLAAAAMVLLAGCTPRARVGGSRSSDVVLHEQREQIDALESQVAQLEAQIDQRIAQIDQLQQQIDSPSRVDGVTPADLPRMVRISLGRYSSALDMDGDGADELLRVYVKPVDQEGRFVPVAGRATVQAVVLRPGSEPVVIAEAAFDPEQWASGYREGFTGVHYTLEAPIAVDRLPADAVQLAVKVVVTDAATGSSASAQTSLVLSRAQASRP